jgi:hypothetical protein
MVEPFHSSNISDSDSDSDVRVTRVPFSGNIDSTLRETLSDCFASSVHPTTFCQSPAPRPPRLKTPEFHDQFSKHIFENRASNRVGTVFLSEISVLRTSLIPAALRQHGGMVAHFCLPQSIVWGAIEPRHGASRARRPAAESDQPPRSRGAGHRGRRDGRAGAHTYIYIYRERERELNGRPLLLVATEWSPTLIAHHTYHCTMS